MCPVDGGSDCVFCQRDAAAPAKAAKPSRRELLRLIDELGARVLDLELQAIGMSAPRLGKYIVGTTPLGKYAYWTTDSGIPEHND